MLMTQGGGGPQPAAGGASAAQGLVLGGDAIVLLSALFYSLSTVRLGAIIMDASHTPLTQA